MLQLIVVRFKWCSKPHLMSMDGTSNMNDELVLGVAIHYAAERIPNIPHYRDPEFFTDFEIVARHNYE